MREVVDGKMKVLKNRVALRLLCHKVKERVVSLTIQGYFSTRVCLEFKNLRFEVQDIVKFL